MKTLTEALKAMAPDSRAQLVALLGLAPGADAGAIYDGLVAAVVEAAEPSQLLTDSEKRACAATGCSHAAFLKLKRERAGNGGAR